MLVGRGGNMGLSAGADGSFLVDDQYAPLTDKIVEAIETLTDDPVRFLVNTHLHGDHTGGNENFGRRGAIVVAHDNVRRRMSVDQFRSVLRDDTVPASPPEALPKITFSEEVTFYWNGNEINVFYVPNAHTDSDSIIHFKTSDVFHMGDTFFNGSFPFIDVDLGGHVNGVIDAAGQVLARATSDSKIIPGHGELASPDDLRAYRDMLVDVRDRVQTMVNDGEGVDAVVAADPAASYEASGWPGNKERFVRAVYFSLAGAP
jgi:glyoxylase-like metal-dependent hydrolase (beta-lactamase superfamily II)